MSGSFLLNNRHLYLKQIGAAYAVFTSIVWLSSAMVGDALSENCRLVDRQNRNDLNTPFSELREVSHSSDTKSRDSDSDTGHYLARPIWASAADQEAEAVFPRRNLTDSPSSRVFSVPLNFKA